MLLTSSILKEARRAAGLTQAELAERIGTSQPEIARLESPRANPRLSTLQGALAATGFALEASLRPVAAPVDESLIAANLRLDPRERLERFAEAYRGISELAHKARGGHGP